MKGKKTIGILGGMGPEATLYCFQKIIEATPAKRDQDHFRVVMDSNPNVPDRTAAIVGGGPSPVPMLVKGCEALERAGADFIVMPCVSAHFFQEELRKQIRLPLISIFDAVVDNILETHSEIRTVGLMGTSGTVQGGLFQKRLAAGGIETVVCDVDQQALVMAAIYDIKNAQPARSRTQITVALVAAAESLVSHGAEGIIAGCTEIPLALKQEDLAAPYFDAVEALARSAVRCARG